MLFLLFSRQVMSYSFATPWTVACQPPLSMGFPRQQYWRGFPFPSPHIYYTNILYTHTYIFDFLKFCLDGKESVCNAGDPGLILESGIFSGEGNSCPLQYSCLKNSMGRGAWPTTVHGLQKVGHYWVTNTHTFSARANKVWYEWMYISPHTIQQLLISIHYVDCTLKNHYFIFTSVFMYLLRNFCQVMLNDY